MVSGCKVSWSRGFPFKSFLKNFVFCPSSQSTASRGRTSVTSWAMSSSSRNPKWTSLRVDCSGFLFSARCGHSRFQCPAIPQSLHVGVCYPVSKGSLSSHESCVGSLVVGVATLALLGESVPLCFALHGPESTSSGALSNSGSGLLVTHKALWEVRMFLNCFHNLILKLVDVDCVLIAIVGHELVDWFLVPFSIRLLEEGWRGFFDFIGIVGFIWLLCQLAFVGTLQFLEELWSQQLQALSSSLVRKIPGIVHDDLLPVLRWQCGLPDQYVGPDVFWLSHLWIPGLRRLCRVEPNSYCCFHLLFEPQCIVPSQRGHTFPQLQVYPTDHPRLRPGIGCPVWTVTLFHPDVPPSERQHPLQGVQLWVLGIGGVLRAKWHEETSSSAHRLVSLWCSGQTEGFGPTVRTSAALILSSLDLLLAHVLHFHRTWLTSIYGCAVVFCKTQNWLIKPQNWIPPNWSIGAISGSPAAPLPMWILSP